MANIIRQRLQNASAVQQAIDATESAQITFLDVRTYGAENSKGEKNQLAGVEYYRFAYRNNVFTSRDAAFLDAVRNRQLSSVTFAVTEETLTDAEITAGKVPKQFLEVLSYDIFEIVAKRLESETILIDAETENLLAIARRAQARAQQRAMTTAPAPAPAAATASAPAPAGVA